MNIYKIRGLNDKTAIAPIRIAIRVVYRDNNEYAYTMFRDTEQLLEAINDIDIKKYVIERIYLANNVGKEYEALDDEEIELYEFDKLPVYGALINS
jgi:hypothetical protein